MAELQVSRESVADFLRKPDRQFVIPDYQRPYKWDQEECETLWEDITRFAEEYKDKDYYFLGTIVTYSNSKTNKLEIIDGQQRVTTLMLLLRAIYTKLSGMTEDDQVRGLKSQIAPCIWQVDSVSLVVKDYTSIRIHSEVATESDNQAFHSILHNGTASTNSDLYSKNYNFFVQKLNEYAQNQPLEWYKLCVIILNSCIVFPIEANDFEAALTIFSTLNDRGMPLSDSDIFKAKLYKIKTAETERKQFSKDWKELTEIANDAGIKVDDLFRYYSHVIRARENVTAKEFALRKFYIEKEEKNLKSDADLMPRLKSLAWFWYDINSGNSVDDADFAITPEARKYIHCLTFYPNDFWKYIASVFYFANRGSQDFGAKFEGFLKHLTTYLFIQFLRKPTVNAIKDDIYRANIKVFNQEKPAFPIDLTNLNEIIKVAYSWRIARSLLLLHAYLNERQTDLIGKFEIEHIFPKKWQDTNYNGWNRSDAAEYLELFGNKVVIGKKLNTQAGNSYFGQKKGKYSSSNIADVLDLSNYASNDWLKEDIEKRQAEFEKRLLEFFAENT